MKVTLSVGGMNCGHCVKALTGELSKLPGIDGLSVEVGSATFSTASVNEAAIRAAVEEAGYELLSITSAAA